MLDLAGAIVELYAFDAYGNAIGFNPADALTEFLYSGEQFDSKIGQQYLRARYYDPAIGRFNRLDPFFGNLDDPQSFHKYLYTHADPVNGIDPMGLNLCSSLGSLAISTGIAGLSGAAVIGAHNVTMHGGKFLPDAMILGGSVTFSLKTLEKFAQKATNSFSNYINLLRL
ncbi:MAG: RHS repeat-associated core domain-containing protein [Planctomycetaceae bacterium]|nr:RHS repeat-associated core domain-containing protein [Planctomycetaceae bacterium]